MQICAEAHHKLTLGPTYCIAYEFDLTNKQMQIAYDKFYLHGLLLPRGQ